MVRIILNWTGSLKLLVRENHQHFMDTLLNWAVVLTGLVVERVIVAISFIVLARGTTLAQYGQFVSCFALANLLLVLPNFGMDEWFLTQSKNSPETVASLYQRSIWFRRQLLILWFIGIGLLAFILPRSTYPPLITITIALGLCFDSLTALIYSTLRVARKNIHITVIQLVSSSVLVCLVLLLPSGQNRVLVFTTGRVILSLSIFLISFFITKNDLNTKMNSAILLPPKYFFQSAFTFFKTEIASTIYINADKTIIPFTLGTTAAAIYGPATNLLQVTFLIPRALYYFIVPDLTRAFHQTRSIYRRKVFFQFLAMSSTGLIVSLFIYAFAPWIINLTFGGKYLTSTIILLILSPIAFLRSINFALAAVLISGGLQIKRNRVQWVSAIFNVIANLIIIVPYGVVGVAWVYVFSEVILMIGYAWLTIQNGLFHSRKDYQPLEQ